MQRRAVWGKSHSWGLRGSGAQGSGERGPGQQHPGNGGLMSSSAIVPLLELGAGTGLDEEAPLTVQGKNEGSAVETQRSREGGSYSLH